MAGEVDWAHRSRAAVSEFDVSSMFKHAECCLRLQRMPKAFKNYPKLQSDVFSSSCRPLSNAAK